jgi:hypothetical protein
LRLSDLPSARVLGAAQPRDGRSPDGSDEPSASPDDRGHDGPQSLPGDAAILPACGYQIQSVLRPLARPGRGGRGAPVPDAPGRARRLLVGVQSDRLRVALLLRGDAGPARVGRADPACPRAAQAAGRAQRRRGGAFPGSGRTREAPDGPDHRLRRRPAGVRGGSSAGRRHRQRPDGDPRHAWQGRQGALRHAVAAAARPAARLLAAGAAGAVAVSRPPCRPSAASERVAGGLPGSPRRRRAGQAGDGAHAAAQLRHPSAGTGHRHPHHPGAARAQQPGDHRPLHPGRHQHDRPDPEPARPAQCLSEIRPPGAPPT